MLKTRAPFASEEKRRELLVQLNLATGLAWEEDAIERRPSIALKLLKNPHAMQGFLKVLDRIVLEIANSE